MRSPEQLLEAYGVATKDSPLIVANGEHDNFIKAMKISGAQHDAQLGNKSIKLTLQDRDILLKEGVLSPLDQKTAFHNRREWNEHLKVNGCVEIGNDYGDSTKKKREIKGDFDCREALAQAVNQVGEKYGY